MSRMLLALGLAGSLLAGLATPAFADRIAEPPSAPRFAVPPPRAPESDPRAVREALAAARAANLARFRAYYRARVYPQNVYADKLTNVWRDEAGHYCAAATIIRKSGQQDLVELVDRVAEQNNFIRLAEVKEGPLMDWILTSGFTQEEIALIQRPFMPVADANPVVAKKLSASETRRLAKLYREIDDKLVRNERTSLDRATERVMKQRLLAQSLVFFDA